MKRLFFAFICYILTLVFPSAGIAANCGKLPPVDEANQDLSFLFFRENLMKAVQEKDPSSLRIFVASKAQTSLGTKEATPKEFLTQWTEENSGHDFWKDMEKVLNLGGAFETPRTFTAPYVTARWGKATTCEASDFVAVLEKEQAAYLSPKGDAPPSANLSYSIVSVEDVPGNAEWVQVKLDSEKTG